MASDPPPDPAARIVTIPNVITLVRLVCVPVFVWLLADDELLAAAGLLAVLGATDWVDGWVARRFDQGSDLGKVFDPVADRILLLVAGVALVGGGGRAVGGGGGCPVFGVPLRPRGELGGWGGGRARAGAAARRIDVQWV